MKTKHLPFFAIFLLLTTFSCNKPQDDASPDTFDISYFLKCKIDGNSFAAKTSLVSFGADLAKKDEYFSIAANDKDGNRVTIWLEGPLKEGTFETQTFSTNIKAFILFETSSSQSWSTNDENGSGTITIQKNHSKYLEGSFSFTAINAVDGSKKVFSSGSFRAKKL